MSTLLNAIASKHPLTTATYIFNQYDPVDLATAYQIALKLGCKNALVLHEGEYTALKDLVLEYSEETTCDKVKIKFWGGPPGFGTNYFGTVRTYIIDCIANALVIDGYRHVLLLLGT
jgi:hypothetical protein